MRPVEVVEKLDATVRAYVEASGRTDDGGFAAVASSPTFEGFRSRLNDLGNTVTQDDVSALVEALTAKRAQVRNGWELHELDDETLVTYSALGDMLLIATAEHLCASMNRAYLDTFVRAIVPVMQTLAPIIIDALVTTMEAATTT